MSNVNGAGFSTPKQQPPPQGRMPFTHNRISHEERPGNNQAQQEMSNRRVDETLRITFILSLFTASMDLTADQGPTLFQGPMAKTGIHGTPCHARHFYPLGGVRLVSKSGGNVLDLTKFQEEINVTGEDHRDHNYADLLVENRIRTYLIATLNTLTLSQDDKLVSALIDKHVEIFQKLAEETDKARAQAAIIRDLYQQQLKLLEELKNKKASDAPAATKDKITAIVNFRTQIIKVFDNQSQGPHGYLPLVSLNKILKGSFDELDKKLKNNQIDDAYNCFDFGLEFDLYKAEVTSRWTKIHDELNRQCSYFTSLGTSVNEIRQIYCNIYSDYISQNLLLASLKTRLNQILCTRADPHSTTRRQAKRTRLSFSTPPNASGPSPS